MRNLGLGDLGFLASVTPAASLLLDLYPNAAAAYSLRLLRSAYTGAVVRVRRSSDSTEQDFTAAQVTDGTLTAFCGAASGFVRTWYDQSGNGRNASQASTSSQPLIVNNGVLIQENSGPAIFFNGSTHRLDVPAIAFDMNAISVNAVCKLSTTTEARLFFGSPDLNRLYVPIIASSVLYVGYATSSTAFNFGAANLTNRYLWQLNASAFAVNAWRNNAASTALASSSTFESGTNLSIGSYLRTGITSNFWHGTGQEVIFYTSDQTANRSAIAANINAHYAIY